MKKVSTKNRIWRRIKDAACEKSIKKHSNWSHIFPPTFLNSTFHEEISLLHENCIYSSLNLKSLPAKRETLHFTLKVNKAFQKFQERKLFRFNLFLDTFWRVEPSLFKCRNFHRTKFEDNNIQSSWNFIIFKA